MEKILYFDCLSGISGDMTLGALLDLGIDKDILINELKKLNVDGFDIDVTKKVKEGIQGTDVYVNLLHDHEHSHSHEEHSHDHEHGHSHEEHSHDHSHEHNHDHVHRNLYDIEQIIDNSTISDRAKRLSKDMFMEVAKAEAKVHGKSIDEIHFHEVGALDSIVDIIGVAICMDILDVDHVYASPIHLGTGFVNCAHGIIPVPAPATMEILKGIKVYSKGIESELVTPTGAAIIKTLAEDFIPMPSMEIIKIGYGMGKKQLPIKNMLRVVLGKKKQIMKF